MNTARTRAAAVLAVAASALSLLTAGPAVASAATSPGWTTWGNSPSRQSRATTAKVTVKNAKKLKLAWSRPLGGVGAAQPLYLSRIAVDGKTRDIYVAASESGRITAFDAQSGRILWKRELGAVSTGCAQMPHGTFGVTGTPVYDPVGGFVYVAATDKLWALNVHSGAVRGGWPVQLPVDQYHEHVWGAIALGNGHVYFGIASYCDRRPYSGRVLAVSTKTAEVDHSWTVVSVPGGTPGGGGIWGWGGVAMTADGHVWAASANANIAAGAEEATDHAESVIELSSALDLVAASHAPGMPAKGDFGFGSTPIVFSPARCSPLVAAEGKDGALYVWQRSKLAAGPVQRLALAFPATLYGSPAWDPATQRLFLTSTQGYAGQPAGLDALAVTRSCRLRRVWTRALGGQLNAIPTIANNAVLVATGTGLLRVYAAASGKLVAQRNLGGAAFVAPIAVGRDVAVVTWSRKLMVYRLP